MPHINLNSTIPLGSFITSAAAIDSLSRVDPSFGPILPTNNSDWKLLFDYYNQNNQPTLKMGCRPCYFKVYNFVRGIRNA